MGRRRKILDANVLINHWRRLGLSTKSLLQVKAAALALIDLYDTNLIASPVRIEFLAGVLSDQELRRSLAFLAVFKAVDEREVPAADWEEAERIAKRVRSAGRRRKLGDCLLAAIANRLSCDVVTGDLDFVQRVKPIS
jgi:predicted nucleic acid-binding protein